MSIKCIPQSTNRVRALCALTRQLAVALEATSKTLYKLLLALASLFQEPKTWLPVLWMPETENLVAHTPLLR